MLTRDRVDSIVWELARQGYKFDMDRPGPTKDSVECEINPCWKETIENMSGFIPYECYSDETNWHNELGFVGNMRILLKEDVQKDKIAIRDTEAGGFNVEMSNEEKAVFDKEVSEALKAEEEKALKFAKLKELVEKNNG